MAQHCWHILDKINHINDGIFSATLTGWVDGGENSWIYMDSGQSSVVLEHSGREQTAHPWVCWSLIEEV